MESQNNKPGAMIVGEDPTRKLDCIQGDGMRHDIWVQFPGLKEPTRPSTFFLIDNETQKILAWRTAEAPCGALVVMAICDVIETFGVPNTVIFDTAREFSVMWMAGKAPDRFRFLVRAKDPVNLLTALGVKIVWTMPYSGQSKPIERSFRDLREEIAKHPDLAKFQSSQDGHNAIPADEFDDVLKAVVARWNDSLAT